jgi:hypothetical protein
MLIQNKFCKFCNQLQPTNNFNKHKACLLGLSNKCKTCVKLYRKQYNKDNIDTILEYNIEYNKTYNPQWDKKNPHIVFWRSLVSRYSKSNNYTKKDKTEMILGYSNLTFKTHIENQFKNDMTWENIHIDHKIPLSWFKNNTPISIVNNLSNLHPLFAFDNISKLNRFSHKVDKQYLGKCKKFINKKYLDKIH